MYSQNVWFQICTNYLSTHCYCENIIVCLVRTKEANARKHSPFSFSCLFSSCIPPHSKYIVFFNLPPAGSNPCQKNYLLICFSVSVFILLILSHLMSSEDDEVHFEIYLNLLQNNNNFPLHRIYTQDIKQINTKNVILHLNAKSWKPTSERINRIQVFGPC